VKRDDRGKRGEVYLSSSRERRCNGRKEPRSRKKKKKSLSEEKEVETVKSQNYP